MTAMTITYLLPILAALLIVLFYMGLPSLKECPLKRAEPAERKMRRGDWLAAAVIALCYAVVAFIGLGDTEAAQNPHVFSPNESVTVKLESAMPISKLRMFCGINVGNYYIECSEDGENWDYAGEFAQNYVAVLKWKEVELSDTVTTEPVRYLRITADNDMYLNEIAVYSPYGDQLGITSADAPELCDEQEHVPDAASFMNSSYFDEIYHVRTAIEHQKDIWPYEVSHPPLGKLIIGIGISLFGVTPFGWRFMGTLFGVLMLPVMYVFLKKLFGGKVVPVLGTVIFAADFMHYVQTRIATIDTYAVFFILLMYLFMYLWCEDGKKRYLALSGLFFGIGAASKWTCIYAGAGLAVIWALHWIVRAYHRKDEENGGNLFGKFLRNCGFCVVFFVLVPAAIYYVSYYHYGAAKGLTGIGAFFTKEYAQIVLDNQSFMFTYHSGVTASHPYSSRWYQWVLDIRPILYYLDYGTDGTRQSFGAFVNPILCWAGLIALFVLGYEAAAKRDRCAAFILIGYLAQLLPWVFITRITFEYHYFACTVFLVLALGYVIALMRQWNPRWRVYAVGMAVLCVAMFIMFYPALSGMRVDNAAASRLLRWLPTWPF